VGNVLASVFCDERGILLIDYLPQGATVNGKYCVDVLTRLEAEIRAKCPHLKKTIFHHDNARSHTCNVTNAKLEELG
jgi:hypothetical protein